MQSDGTKCILCGCSPICCVSTAGSDYDIFRCTACGIMYKWPLVKQRHVEKLRQHYHLVDPVFDVAYSRTRLYKNLLRQFKNRNIQGRLLDIGCSWGYFLTVAREYGWDCYGIDIASELVKIGIETYGLKMQCCSLESVDFQDGFFDLVTLWNVFDELMDPEESVLRIKRLLKPGGVLFLRIPNGNFYRLIYCTHHVLRKMQRYRIADLLKSEFSYHVFTYNTRAIRFLLEKNGFQKIAIRNSSLTEGDPYQNKTGTLLLKHLAYVVAQFFSLCSFRRCLISPSIEVYAEANKEAV